VTPCAFAVPMRRAVHPGVDPAEGEQRQGESQGDQHQCIREAEYFAFAAACAVGVVHRDSCGEGREEGAQEGRGGQQPCDSPGAGDHRPAPSSGNCHGIMERTQNGVVAVDSDGEHGEDGCRHSKRGEARAQLSQPPLCCHLLVQHLYQKDGNDDEERHEVREHQAQNKPANRATEGRASILLGFGAVVCLVPCLGGVCA
jgi:hypothetical protein